MQLSESAKKILEALSRSGFEAYAVGGCVRDFLLGKPVSDTDIASPSLPQETEEILRSENIKVVETGIKHGTVTAVVDKTPYEITTFRADGDYKDCRRPESVEFVRDIKEDLKRRDFTVNAMAYSEKSGIIDLFGGRQDLENKIIRAVGDPDKRFKEDALRIMRALRFSSVLGFDIEPNTKKALMANRELLNNIAPERVFSELMKLLCGRNAFKVLDEYREVLAVVIPELKSTFSCAQNTPWHEFDVYNHIINAVAYAPADPVIRLTMLLHDIGKPSVKTTDENGRDHFKTHAAAGERIAADILRRFRVSNKIYDKVTTLIKYHQSVENVNDIKIKRWFNKIGEEYTLSLFDVRIADLKAHNTAKAEVRAEIETLLRLKQEALEIIGRGEAFRISDLAVNGNDLLHLGFSGREIGDKLQEILSLVLENKLKNEKSEIMGYLSKHNNS